MLRTIKSPQITPRVQLYSAQIDDGDIFMLAGEHDGDASIAAGVGLITLKKGYARSLLNFFCGVGTSTGLIHASTAPTNKLTSEFQMLTAAAGVPADAAMNALVLGHHSVRDLSHSQGRGMGFPVTITRAGMPTAIWGHVTAATPAVTGTTGVTVARPSTGTFDISFKRPGSRACMAFAVLNTATEGKIDVSAQANTGFRVRTYNSSDALANINFSFLVFTFSHRLEQAGMTRALKNDQRNPRLIAAAVDGATSEVIGGGTDFTVEQLGTGSYVVSFLPYARNPVLLAQAYGDDIIRAQVSSIGSAEATITFFDEDGSEIDPEVFHVLAIGSDDSLTY